MNIYNRKKLILILTLTLILILGAIPVAAAEPELIQDESKKSTCLRELDRLAEVCPHTLDNESLQFYIETLNYIKDNYPFEINNRDLINNSIKGLLQGLDENSDYYPKEEADVLLRNLMGSYAGIGVVVEQKEEYVIINSIMKNSPAEKSRLKKGDIIVSVDNIKIKDLSLEEISLLIRGLPDTKVKLGVLRKGSSTPIYIEITRADIIINPVDYDIIKKDIGYIKISQFNTYTTKNIKEALKEFDKKNIDKIILDLRDNPGGLLDQAISISELFIPAGPIVHIRDKKGLTTYISTNKNPKYKLAVLVNEYSASASEILAGAVKEREAGTLIGKKTYGKGTVQTMMFLKDGSILKLTIAEYLLPNKTSIHKKGIEPDIEVDNVDGKDLQLKKAIEIINHM